MNPEIKAKWVAALKSGEYRQGHSQLKQDREDGPAFCCLGVLTDLWIKEHQGDPAAKWIVRPDGVCEGPGIPRSMPFMPPFVAEWAGLVDGFMGPSVTIQRLVDGSHSHPSLVALNDCRLYTFSQIADVIEEHL